MAHAYGCVLGGRIPIVFRFRYLFLVIILVTAFVGIFDHDLWGPDEPRVAETGREFLDEGSNLALPRLDKEPFLEQPPLYYWTLAVSYTIFGAHNDVTARVPSIFFGLLTVLITFLFVKKLYGSETAIKAAAVLSFVVVFFSAAHRCIVDSALVFFVTLSMYFLHSALNSKGGKKIFYYTLCYFAVVGAIFSKGFVGLAFPVAFFVCWVVWTRDWKEIVKAQPWLGAAIVGSLVGIWLYLLGTTGSWDYAKEWFFHNNILRFIPFLGKYRGSHENPFYTYLGSFWNAFAPWCILVPAIFVWAWRRRKEDRNLMFMPLWFASGFVILSVAGTKRAIYLAPLSAPVAILTAMYLQGRMDGKIEGMLFRISEKIFVALLSLLPLVFVGAAIYMRFYDTVPFIVFLPLIMVSCFVFLRSYMRNRKILFLPITAYLLIIYAGSATTAYPVMNREESVRPAYAGIRKILEERNAPLYAFGASEFSRGAMPFYTGHFMKCLRNYTDVENVSKDEQEVLMLVVDRTKDCSIFKMIQQWFPAVLYYTSTEYGGRPMWLLSNKPEKMDPMGGEVR